MLFNATPAVIDKELKAARKEKEKIEKGIEKLLDLMLDGTITKELLARTLSTNYLR